MLDRLESARREAARTALAAQEAERLRVARELHDEIGQTLTAVTIQAERAAESDPDKAAALERVADAVRESLDEVRRIARELRPEALDDLGLVNALIALCTRVGAQDGPGQARAPRQAAGPVARHGARHLPHRAGKPHKRPAPLGRRSATVSLVADAETLTLTVTDDGKGMPLHLPSGTAGIAGMRERALLVGGRLSIESRPDRGTEVRLSIPSTGGVVTVPLKTRILLADDHEVVRDGLRMVLDSAPDLEVVAQAGDGLEAVELALKEDVDLAVLDVTMPHMTGLQAALELSRRKPELRVLILSMHDNEQYFFEALKAGASGYVLKSVANRDLIEACRATMRGEPFLYPAAVRALVRDYLDRASRGETTPEDPLSPRELEVVTLIAEGLTSEEIAEKLYISKKTVDRHRANMLEKLGMRNRVELTRYAIRRGLVVP